MRLNINIEERYRAILPRMLDTNNAPYKGKLRIMFSRQVFGILYIIYKMK